MNRNKPLLIALLIFVSVSSYVSSQQSDARAAFREAEDARGAGSIYLAIERYKEAIALNPQYVDALEGLSESYFSIGEYSEALEHVHHARSINRTSVALATLEGRIMLGLGDFTNAEERFIAVLSQEPNNMNALFGLAELDVAEGRPASAAQRFAAGLRAQPGNVRALLSLVTLNDAAGNAQAAERYVREALVSASGDPLVRYIAAKHYFAHGDLDEARHHVDLAIEIRPDFIDAVRLSGAISLRSGSYVDAVGQLEQLLSRDGDDYLLWYSLGVAYERTGQYEKGLNAFARTLNIRSDDEISRLALEQLLIAQYPVDSEIRERYAKYRFTAAKAFLKENLSEAALEHYRRGLLLYPRSKDGRFGYASIYKTREHYAKYVSELNVLVELELDDREIADEVEIYESILSEAVHNTWEQEQFLIDRARHAVKIFSVTGPSAVLHPEADATLLKSLTSLLRKFENIDVLESSDDGMATGFSHAFELSRESGSDYFILVDFVEREREIAMIADIYHGETGAKLFSYITQNTGNGRVELSLRKFSRVLHSILPFQARLIERRFGDGLIDAGSLNGVEVGQEFLVVKSGSLENSRSEIGFSYQKEDVLGTFTVTLVDDLLAEGTIKPAGFFDRINLNDMVILSPVQKSDGDEGADVNTDASVDGEGNPESDATDEPDSLIDTSSDRVDPLYRELLRIP